MKVLYLEWNCYCNNFVKAEMMRRGYDVVIFPFPQDKEDTRQSEELASLVAMKAIENAVDFVFSLNYFPVAAIAANACRIKYVSWTYDSPYIQLYSRTIDYPTNYAFVFDKAEYNRLKGLGIDTVYYLPMAAPTSYYDKVTVNLQEQKKYDADIAMIGSTYSEKKHRLMRHFDNADVYIKGYLDAVVGAQKSVYGANIMEEAITDELVEQIQKEVPIFSRGDGYESEAWVISNYFLARKLTAMERQEYLSKLSDFYKVALYTYEKTPNLPKVENRGPVEYYEEMAKAMKCAKINLNITLRSIVSGIPLRAFDIMGNGGFLLTNYQEDFLDFFVPGVDFACFESLDDLVEKAGYYLSHEDERMEIARNGFEKIREMHNFSVRFDEIERVAGL